MATTKFLKTFLLTAVFALPGLLCADSAKKTEVKQIKIRFETANRMPGDLNTNSKISTVKFTNGWLLIYIDYSPRFSGKNDWLDDVRLDCQVAVPGVGRAQDWVIFQGKTTFWTMYADGRGRTALMAIPPQLLDRYLPAGKRLQTGALVAKVVFTAANGKPIGIDYICPNTANVAAAAKYFDEIEKKLSTIKVTGGIFHRDMTPWKYEKMDQTDLVRFEQD